MSVETLLGGGLAGVLGLWATRAASHRRSERELREQARSGNTVFDLGDGRVEYRTWGADHRDGPIVVCENGLGAPLECWDWVAEALSSSTSVVAYHRAGYGATTATSDPGALIQGILRREFDGSRPVVLLAHSIGGMAVRAALAHTPDLARRVVGVCLVDSTDPSLLDAVWSDPERRGRIMQSMHLEMVGAVLGTTTVANPVLDEVDHRSSVQQRFARFVVDTRTVRTATREYRRFSEAASALSRSPLPPTLVLSASNSHEGSTAHMRAQRSLADGLGATHQVVHGAGHRSILGFRRHAETVADQLERWYTGTCVRSVEEVAS
ncbi:alpha/beta fold hydrolase [Williamsia deligens]|uniref:Alpha/beta fold hydrolase n=1 Tax=Williamsia deligens TaxID=321325 RepID=A0ABW3G2J1_9NOCA|nr:alpha/beta hydrolase [Williamsia deligens]MCP2194564.1 Pimeloyl-ACP methyl ester carboxylesterase [Williamsia deligens]